MGKHIVTCVKCGRQFDANEGVGRYYTKQRRYECKSCYDAQMKTQKERAKAERVAQRESDTGMRQSNAAMIAKIVIGVLFLIGSFPLVSQGNYPAFIFGLCVASVLILWGVVPYFTAKK